jgi:hypothetical protein
MVAIEYSLRARKADDSWTLLGGTQVFTYLFPQAE